MEVQLPRGGHAELDPDGVLIVSRGDRGLELDCEQSYLLAVWLSVVIHRAGPCFECGELAPANSGHIYRLPEGDVLLCQPCHEQRQQIVEELLNTVIE